VSESDCERVNLATKTSISEQPVGESLLGCNSSVQVTTTFFCSSIGVNFINVL